MPDSWWLACSQTIRGRSILRAQIPPYHTSRPAVADSLAMAGDLLALAFRAAAGGRYSLSAREESRTETDESAWEFQVRGQQTNRGRESRKETGRWHPLSLTLTFTQTRTIFLVAESLDYA